MSRAGLYLMDTGSQSVADHITVHLLDSASDEPVQTWHFEGRSRVVIGRSHEVDVTVNNRYVSRNHAELAREGGVWQVVPVGRNGILVDNRRVETTVLTDGMTFRLGPDGPAIRFHAGVDDAKCSATLSFDGDAMALLILDEQQKAEEVRAITDTPYFQQLQELAAHLRRSRAEAGPSSYVSDPS